LDKSKSLPKDVITIETEATKEIILTEEGHKNLLSELEELKNVKRREIAERLRNAISYGDLTENSEYDDAKNEQARLEHRIDQLETLLAEAKVVTRRQVKTKEVGIGSVVEIRQVGTNKKQVYKIVGPMEADPEKRMISYKSPVGKNLLGKKVGDIITVQAPAGEARFRIVSITK